MSDALDFDNITGELLIKPEFLLPRRDNSGACGQNDSADVKRVKLVGDSCDDVETKNGADPPISSQTTARHNNSKNNRKGGGQKRPVSARPPQAADKLCPSLKDRVHGEPPLLCPVLSSASSRLSTCGDAESTGESARECRYRHDVQQFVAERGADIGTACPVFEALGRCPSGLACRFGSSHTTPDLYSVCDEERWHNTCSQPVSIVNRLSSDTQRLLWKRRYDFSAAQTALARHDTRPHANHKTNGPSPADSASNETTVASAATSVCADQLKETNSSSSAHKVAPECVSLGSIADDDSQHKQLLRPGLLYLAPLTTLGNLPFRRVCVELGADVTCGEMAMSSALLQGCRSEWTLVRRHKCERIFGVQICGSNPGVLTRCTQLLNDTCDVDFIDLNMGCPIDLVYNQGAGSALMRRRRLLESACRSMCDVSRVPITLKMRAGVYRDVNTAHDIVSAAADWGVSMVTVHGRSREQRYTRRANWHYIGQCAATATETSNSQRRPLYVYGNGDVLSWQEYWHRLEGVRERDVQQADDDGVEGQKSGVVDGVMVARGALIKPWIFTEIKERRTWDISSTERLDLLRKYVNCGLEYWGSDKEGVERTRRFLLEWLSFLYRYVPVGVLAEPPQKINQRPAAFCARDQLETVMASGNSRYWVQISEMLLGPVPEEFVFVPKHAANSYS